MNSSNDRSMLLRPSRRAMGSMNQPRNGGNSRLNPSVSVSMYTPSARSVNLVKLLARHKYPLSRPAGSRRSLLWPAFSTSRISSAFEIAYANPIARMGIANR